MSFLTEISLKKASVTLLVAIALVAAGIYAALSINQELMPDIDFPLVTVVTAQPGGSPEDIAAEITAPLEGAVASVAGIKSLQSVSAENFSILIAQWDYGYDMKAAADEVSNAVNGVSLPPGATRPDVTRLNLNEFLPVVQLSLSGDMSTAELERVARTSLVPRIDGISGVHAVDIIGGTGQQLEVVLDTGRMNELGLTTQQVSGVLQASNISIPAGTVGTDTGVLPLRTISQLESLEEIEKLFVGLDTTGDVPAPIALKDIATVQIAKQTASGVSRINGLPSVGVTVSKMQGANTVRVANAIMEEVEAVRESYGDGLRIDTILDQSTFIEESITGLTREGLIGAAAAVIAIWLFLMSFRSAIAAAVSIPLSLVVAILVLFLQGFTVNILTLGGLAIAVGRVVDDSIVVLENIFRHVQEGDDLNTSVLEGTREVAVAIFGSTMTTVAVFLPLGFVGGIVGVMFRPFALTVTIALLASLVVALTVVPILARFLVGRRQLGTRRDPGDRRTVLQRGYTPILRWALSHRALTLVIAALLFFGSLVLVRFIPTAFIPSSGEKEFYASISLPADLSTPEKAIEKAIEAEEIIAALPDVDTYSTLISLGTGTGVDIMSLGRMLQGGGTRGASITVRLHDDADLKAVEEMAREQLRTIEGVHSIVEGSHQDLSSSLEIAVTGAEPDVVKAAALDVLAAVNGTPGVIDVSSAAVVSLSEVAVDVDPARALGVGLTGAQVGMGLRELTVGQTVPSVRLDGQAMDVVMRADKAGIGDVEALGALTIGSFQGIPIPLSAIATIEKRDAPAQISRRSQKPAATITGTIIAENTGEVNADIVERVDAVPLPPGVEIVYGGIQQQFMEAFNDLYFGIIAGVVIVYIVMVLVMGSLLSPFVIMFCLPLASIGALAALAITGRALSMPAMFGVLMLVGIVVTNGIVLIDFVNQLRGRGLSVRDALMEGGRLRLRPVLMTAATTILAMIPMSLGFTEGAVIASELATVVIGGLFTSTLLTLVVVPVVYSLVEGLRRRVTGGGQPASSAEAPAVVQE